MPLGVFPQDFLEILSNLPLCEVFAIFKLLQNLGESLDLDGDVSEEGLDFFF